MCVCVFVWTQMVVFVCFRYSVSKYTWNLVKPVIKVSGASSLNDTYQV